MRITRELIFCFFILFPLIVSGQVKFIENKGQWPDSVLYRADISGGKAFITKNAIRYVFYDKEKLHAYHHSIATDSILCFNTHALFVEFVNANPSVSFSHSNPSSEYYNYYTSNDPSRWKSGVKAYSKIYGKDIFPSTGLEIESAGDAIKYTYHLKAGTNPANVRMRIRGAEKLEIKNEELHIYTSVNHIVEQKPFAYQPKGDAKQEVKCNFYIDGEFVGFTFPDGYDGNLPLVIDPTVIFATFSGSLGDNFGFTATYDTLGHGYAGGTVYDIGFPTTPGTFEPDFQGGDTGSVTLGDFPRDAGILKFSPDGSQLLYATYLGGQHNDQPHSMVVDSQHNLIVFGTTFSNDFPVSANAYDKTYNGRGDIFVSKFSEDGTQLLASTYIGDALADGLNGIRTSPNRINRPLTFNFGDQYRGEVICDRFNNIYVATCTQSPGFPVTNGAAQTTFGGGVQDGCAFKLNPDFSNLLWSTFIGGNNYDAAYSLQIDRQQNVFVTGGTVSPYFFSDQNTYQSVLVGDSADAFICKLKNDGREFLEATYFGTNKYDQAYFVQLDKSENVYVFGQTTSRDFPIRNSNFSNPNSGQFIAKFSNDLRTNLFSTVFGSGSVRPDISPGAFLVDDCGKIYVSGWGGEVNVGSGRGGYTYNMPVTPDAFQATTNGSDFYLAVFAQNMEVLLYGSYFGGPISEEHVDGGTSRFDKRGVVYQSVCGGCRTARSPQANSDFPTTPNAWSRINKSDNCNNLLFKVDLDLPDLKAGFNVQPQGCEPLTIRPENLSVRGESFFWDFGDGNTSSAENPIHTFANEGIYTVTLVATNLLSCTERDTVTKQVIVYRQAKANFIIREDSCNQTIYLDTVDSRAAIFYWDFGDGTTSNAVRPSHYYRDTGTFTITFIADSGTMCADTLRKTITITGIQRFAFTVDECERKFQVIDIFVTDSNFYWLINDEVLFNELPTYTFPDEGTYVVKLVVFKANGCVDTVFHTVVIPPYPKAEFSFILDSCTRTVSLQNLSPAFKNLIWYFSDGTEDTTRNPQPHIYQQDGSYNITLIVNPGLSCADTFIQSVDINRPFSSFSYEIDTCTAEYRFVNLSTSGTSSFLWLYGDGTTSTEASPRHGFKNEGTYNVKLITSPGTSCVDSFSIQIEAEAMASADDLKTVNILTINGDGLNEEFRIDGFNFKCDEFELLIFNRWGQLMYKGTGRDLVWRGTNLEGNDVPPGTYYFIMRSSVTGSRQGAITVIR